MNGDRVRYLKINENKNGEYILYWMQESQRTKYNFSLNKAIEIANSSQLPLYVVFNYIEYPEVQKRHYDFMFQGLRDVKNNLKEKGISFIFLTGNLEENIIKVSKNAKIVVWDKAYLKFQREAKKRISNKISSTIIEVEGNVTVPVEVISSKEEYSARTLRIKYKKVKDRFLIEFKDIEYLKFEIKNKKIEKLDVSKMYILEEKEVVNNDFLGGEIEARKKLDYFIKENLKFYLDKGPDNERASKLSPYLNFGQISPLEIWIEIEKIEDMIEQKESFLEELTVRRELAINFVYYNKNYDNWYGVTYNWAYETLENHLQDARKYIYSSKELENAETHDIYWNTCQNEMVKIGYMDSYMRMYWCKKILEWSQTPKEAYQIALFLNNKYFYDGRDPSSYAGVAWCFGKHDRAWKEREIFGKVRYMNSDGLKRKFKMQKYIEKYTK
ncbi:MAG: deoxyribodipyrimidine photo-lyase [Cetobacterium sp.]|uniref:deoxyribodipyrimidine photo-lyase n=1 Tax=Cetobacterium sp. TaxID=2071632 RepID=UPI003F30C288